MTVGDSSAAMPSWVPGTIHGDPRCGDAASAGSALARQSALVIDLVERSRGGCHESYKLLVEIHQDRIFRFCLGWVGNTQDAQEICQDTFIKAYSALPRVYSAGHFSAWIYRIARNHCHDHHRSKRQRNSRKNRPLLPGDGDALICPVPSPDENAAHAEQSSLLDAGIATLPVTLRETLILCCIEGLSHGECAEILSCSRRAVEGRLYRARTQLAEWLERNSA